MEHSFLLPWPTNFALFYSKGKMLYQNNHSIIQSTKQNAVFLNSFPGRVVKVAESDKSLRFIKTEVK